MGSQESKVVITSKMPQQAGIKLQNHKYSCSSNNINKSLHQFYTLQKCNYPHNLIENQKKTKNINEQASLYKCKQSHKAYKKYDICSKCLKQPIALHQIKKIKYQSNQGRYKIFKQNNLPQQNKKVYKQKESGAIGPQIPVYFNGFSLPIQKYYKQKQNFGQFTTQYSRKQQMELYRPNNKEFQISIIQEKKQQRITQSPNKLYEKIDYKGSQQILKLHF